MPVHELRRGIGYVIQQAGLFPHRTVLDNVTTVPRLLGWSKEKRNARARELLELVGLDPATAAMYPAQLSGGQQQRVGVARALAADPPVLLMDEPFGAVDPIVRAQLQREFLRLQRDLAKTVVFVTHDVDEAMLLGTRIAVMQTGGRIAQIGPPAELLANPASEFVRRLPRSAAAWCTTTTALPSATAPTPCSATPPASRPRTSHDHRPMGEDSDRTVRLAPSVGGNRDVL